MGQPHVVEPHVVRLLVGLTARIARVWLLVVALGAAAGAVFAWAPLTTAAEPQVGLGVLVAMAVAFAVAEACVVHLNVGRHAHSFAFADVPFVVALFVLPPGPLLAARLAGAVIALGVVRRLPLVKLAFNLGQLALALGGGLLVWRALSGEHESLAVLAAVVTGACISA